MDQFTFCEAGDSEWVKIAFRRGSITGENTYFPGCFSLPGSACQTWFLAANLLVHVQQVFTHAAWIRFNPPKGFHRQKKNIQSVSFSPFQLLNASLSLSEDMHKHTTSPSPFFLSDRIWYLRFKWKKSALIIHWDALARNKMAQGTQKWFNNDQINLKKKERISQKQAPVDDDSGRWMLLGQSSDRLARRSKHAIKILLIHEAFKFLLLFFLFLFFFFYLWERFWWGQRLSQC